MLTRRHLLHTLPISALAACTTPKASDDGVADLPSAPVTPPIPRQSIQRIALTSCSNPARSLGMFDQVRAKRPELLLMLGDNVYGSSSPRDPALPDLRAAYTKMAASTEFKSLVSQVPTQAIWDDHDFGINDGGGDFAHKALAQAIFNRFWNVPSNSLLRRRQGIYRAFMVGPVSQRIQVILLDTRMFRDPLIPTDVRGAPGKERYLPHPETATVDILGAAQ
jgi:alkaline phosphatase D